VAKFVARQMTFYDIISFVGILPLASVFSDPPSFRLPTRRRRRVSKLDSAILSYTFL